LTILKREGAGHPPLPHPRPAEGLPSHPPLWVLANGVRAPTIAHARELVAVPDLTADTATTEASLTNQKAAPAHRCPWCGGRMIIIETFEAGSMRRSRPSAPIVAIRIDTS
jgi:hypothetical protein